MNERPWVALDRDGTIIVERHYLCDPEQVELIPGAAEGLRRLCDLGLGLVVVTNQSGIGRGLFDVKRLESIHGRMTELLRAQGVELDGVYYCPHVPADGCACRKPQSGLVTQASTELRLAPEAAFVIGDKQVDIDLGRRIGAKTLLVRTGYGAELVAGAPVDCDFVADDLGHAAEIVSRVLSAELNEDAGSEHLRLAQERLLQSAEVKRRTADECAAAIVRAAHLITGTFRAGGKVLLCGNGGSAADCQHMAAEFVSRLTKAFDRPALPAIALTTDSSFLTAFTNDCGFEDVFARQVEAFGTPRDVLIGISTSGGSANVIRAVRAAQRCGMRTIALTGAGGSLRELAHVCVSVPSADTQHIQEAHLAIEHILCDLVERSLFHRSAPSQLEAAQS